MIRSRYPVRWKFLRLLALDILQLDLGVAQLLTKLVSRCCSHGGPRQLQVFQGLQTFQVNQAGVRKGLWPGIVIHETGVAILARHEQPAQAQRLELVHALQECYSAIRNVGVGQVKDLQVRKLKLRQEMNYPLAIALILT